MTARRSGADAVGDWLVLLLGPFLVIGVVGVIAAVITLAIRQRRQWSTRPRPHTPPRQEQGQPADPHDRHL
jgi:hypothetical protein